MNALHCPFDLKFPTFHFRMEDPPEEKEKGDGGCGSHDRGFCKKSAVIVIVVRRKSDDGDAPSGLCE